MTQALSLSDLAVGLAVAIVGFGLTQLARAWRGQSLRIAEARGELVAQLRELREELRAEMTEGRDQNALNHKQNREDFHALRAVLTEATTRLASLEVWAKMHDRSDDEFHAQTRDHFNRVEDHLQRLETRTAKP